MMAFHADVWVAVVIIVWTGIFQKCMVYRLYALVYRLYAFELLT